MFKILLLFEMEITERPHAPSGVAAFISAHSKTPYITPSMDVSSEKGVVRGRRWQQLEVAFCLNAAVRTHAALWHAARRAGGMRQGELVAVGKASWWHVARRAGGMRQGELVAVGIATHLVSSVLLRNFI